MEASPWTKEGWSRIKQTLALRKRWTSRAKSTHSRNGQHLLDQGLGLLQCHGQPLWVRQACPEADPHQSFFKNHKKDSHSESRAGTAEKIRFINRISQLWVWHSFLHAQIKKILVVRLKTRLNQLLAYFPCGPAAGTGRCQLPADGGRMKTLRLEAKAPRGL